MKRFLNRFIPFITLGVAIAVIIFGMMIFAYLLFFGALIGVTLYIFNVVKDKYFAPKKKPGRTIDSDDWRVL
jgi:hypothetical protein